MTTLPDETLGNLEQCIAQGLSSAIFDLDGTLSNTNIATPYLQAMRKRFHNRFWYCTWLGYTYATYGPYYITLDKIDRALMQQRFHRRYRPFDERHLEDCCDAFFKEHGKKVLFPGAAMILRYLRSRGIYIELHSSNIQQFVRPFADFFECPYEAVALGVPGARGPVSVAELRGFKTERLRRFDAMTTAVFADSRSDLAALRSVAFPFVLTDRYRKWMYQINGGFIHRTTGHLINFRSAPAPFGQSIGLATENGETEN